MDEEMASIEKEQKEQAEQASCGELRRAAASWLTLSLSPRRRQVNGGSPGDLRSGETSQGQGQGGMPSFQVVQRAISRCPLSLSLSLSSSLLSALDECLERPAGPGRGFEGGGACKKRW